MHKTHTRYAHTRHIHNTTHIHDTHMTHTRHTQHTHTNTYTPTQLVPKYLTEQRPDPPNPILGLPLRFNSFTKYFQGPLYAGPCASANLLLHACPPPAARLPTFAWAPKEDTLQCLLEGQRVSPPSLSWNCPTIQLGTSTNY